LTGRIARERRPLSDDHSSSSTSTLALDTRRPRREARRSPHNITEYRWFTELKSRRAAPLRGGPYSELHQLSLQSPKPVARILIKFQILLCCDLRPRFPAYRESWLDGLKVSVSFNIFKYFPQCFWLLFNFNWILLIGPSCILIWFEEFSRDSLTILHRVQQTVQQG
jgi:hypothetical protein